MSFNFSELMEKAKNLQQEVVKIKEQSANITATGEAGGGMVSVKMNGNHQCLEVKISPELLQENDVEMLQDLIRGAITNATTQIADKLRDELSKVSNMMPNIPGMDLGI